MKIYISGKISGEDRQAVREKFACAVQQVRDMGHEPVSPLDNGLGWEDQWRDHMAVDIAMLLQCDGIYLLPDWHLSVGARIEANIAAECDMKILRQRNSCPVRVTIEEIDELPQDTAEDLERCESCERVLSDEEVRNSRKRGPICPDCWNKLKDKPEFHTCVDCIYFQYEDIRGDGVCVLHKTLIYSDLPACCNIKTKGKLPQGEK